MEGQICGNAPVTWLGEECDGDCAAFVGECECHKMAFLISRSRLAPKMRGTEKGHQLNDLSKMYFYDYSTVHVPLQI